jgi:hypothetical protein
MSRSFRLVAHDLSLIPTECLPKRLSPRKIVDIVCRFDHEGLD